MKKLLLFCALVLVLVVSACSSDSASEADGGSNDSGNAGENDGSEEAKADSTDYPSEPIEILVPFAAGGSTDNSARILAKYLPQYLPNDVDIVIVNKSGAGGTIAATDLYNAEPDGYTLELATHRGIAMQPNYGETAYSHDSFEGIAKITTNQQVLVVGADAPYDTFEEWLDYVKENPGEFKYGVSGGIGSGSHLPMAELQFSEDLEMEPIAFDGTSPAMTAVLGGNIDGAIGQPSSVKGYVNEGDMKMIFNAASKPVPYAPDVPLLIDEGYDIAYDSNASLLAPGGLPEDVHDILVDAVKQAMEDPDLQKEFEEINIQLDYKGPEGVQEELNDENERTYKILSQLGLL